MHLKDDDEFTHGALLVKVVSSADFATNFCILIPNCIAFVDRNDINWNGVRYTWFFCPKFPSGNGTIIKISYKIKYGYS